MERFFPRINKVSSVGSSIPPQSQNVDAIANVDDVPIDNIDGEDDVSSDDVEGDDGGSDEVDRDDVRSGKRARIEVANEEVIISDPGLRKPLHEYEPSARDGLRRKYVAKGPCQPLAHDFPQKSFGKTMRYS